MSTIALERHLLPLVPYLTTKGVTEICINKPQEVFIEQYGQFKREFVEALDYHFLTALASLVAEHNHKHFPAPLVSGALPTGERIQFVLHPACEKDNIVCSIRLKQVRDFQLKDYAAKGSFTEIKNKSRNNNDDFLIKLYYERNIEDFLTLAILSKKNILISGGTGTGKTTFLNACLKCVPNNERIITVEDTREVEVSQPNTVHLLFNEEDNAITSLNVFKTCLRLRPDRIFLSELRGNEVWPYLRAANSGHPGSLSTVHADTPDAAFKQLVFMMQQAGSTSSDVELLNYIKSVIHIVIQLKRDTSNARYMYVSNIYFDRANEIKKFKDTEINFNHSEEVL